MRVRVTPRICKVKFKFKIHAQPRVTEQWNLFKIYHTRQNVLRSYQSRRDETEEWQRLKIDTKDDRTSELFQEMAAGYWRLSVSRRGGRVHSHPFARRSQPSLSLSRVAGECQTFQGFRVGSPGLDYCCSHIVSGSQRRKRQSLLHLLNFSPALRSGSGQCMV